MGMPPGLRRATLAFVGCWREKGLTVGSARSLVCLVELEERALVL